MTVNKLINFNRAAHQSLLKIYQLKYAPVGIKFIKKDQDFFGLARAKHKNTVCAYLRTAAQGKSFYIDKDCISCPGGLKWMGFDSKVTETFFYKFFLGKIEKAKISPEIAEKFIDFLPEPPKQGLYEKLLFAPLQNCPFDPDVVVIITTSRQAYRMIVASYLDEYHLVKTIPLCSACHGSISIPFTEGELNVSMIDPMARKVGGYKDEEVLVGIPDARFHSLIDNLEKTPFGAKKGSFVTKIIKKVIDYP